VSIIFILMSKISNSFQKDDFYAKIRPFNDFKEVTNGVNFVKVPEDWLIVITDVVMITKTIENGKYKNVNAAGAAVIAAILNVDKNLDLPFVFGGDGATLIVPLRLKNEVITTLQGVQNLAKNLDLDLRASLISATEIYAKNGTLLVAKHKISPKYSQAVLSGDGFDLAEKIIKNPITRHLYEVSQDFNSIADTTGFTCRWQPIPSRFGETISLIIKVLDQKNDLYDKVFSKIEEVYGSAKECHPLNLESLELSLNPKDLETEAKITEKFGFNQIKKIISIVGRRFLWSYF
jgi:hypothetical protein